MPRQNKQQNTVSEQEIVEKIQRDLAKQGFHFILTYFRNGRRGVVSSGDAIIILGLSEFANLLMKKNTKDTFYQHEDEPETEEEYAG